jgi:hypothetical protein
VYRELGVGFGDEARGLALGIEEWQEFEEPSQSLAQVAAVAAEKLDEAKLARRDPLGGVQPEQGIAAVPRRGLPGAKHSRGAQMLPGAGDLLSADAGVREEARPRHPSELPGPERHIEESLADPPLQQARLWDIGRRRQSILSMREPSTGFVSLWPSPHWRPVQTGHVTTPDKPRSLRAWN